MRTWKLWEMAAVAVLVVAAIAGAAVAQTTAPTTAPAGSRGLVDYLRDLGGIIILTMGIVEVLKLVMAKYKARLGRLATCPPPLLAIAIALGLTAVANLATKTLPGAWYEVFFQAVRDAAIAGGFFTWIRKPVGAAVRAVKAPQKSGGTTAGLVLLIGLAAPSCGLTGCAWPAGMPITPAQQLNARKAGLVAARELYDGVGKSIAILRRAGSFTTSQGVQIDMWTNAAFDTLDRWEAAIELGHPTAKIRAGWDESIESLVAVRVAGQRYANNIKPDDVAAPPTEPRPLVP